MQTTFVSLLVATMMLIPKQPTPSFAETAHQGAVQSANSTGKTVWDGIYTAGQAARGKAEYDANCAMCHGSLSAGNRVELLKGNDFMQRWREDNLESLFTFLKSSMPPMRSRSKDYVPLSDTEYLDIMVHILQANEFPAGSEDLNINVLKKIQIQEKDGPKPLATSTLVQMVGCMTMHEEADGAVWMLGRASEPLRTHNSDKASADELKEAEDRPLGTLSFLLQNLGYLGKSFNPNVHVGHKMLAKGVLIRQSNSQRLDITSLTMVDSNCGN